MIYIPTAADVTVGTGVLYYRSYSQLAIVAVCVHPKNELDGKRANRYTFVATGTGLPPLLRTHAWFRYLLDFSPLANAIDLRASLRTRPLRPFSFRVAAFGGSRNPFGFADTNARLRNRWPYCAFQATADTRGLVGLIGGAVGEAGDALQRGERETSRPGERGIGGAVGGGWRSPVSTGLAIGAVTDKAKIAEMARERCSSVQYFTKRSSPGYCTRTSASVRLWRRFLLRVRVVPMY